MPIPLGTYLVSAHSENKPTLQDQWREATETGCVTCPCGLRKSVTLQYRCLYCGIWFCDVCAGEHFGQSYDDRLDTERRKLFDQLMTERKARKAATKGDQQ